jgi:hypothetical membrane protein
MNFITLLKAKLNDPLFTFKQFERFIAAFSALIPLILWLTDGILPHPFRSSISQYVYMNNSYVFGMLLSIASMLFIFNGAIYFKNEQFMHISTHGQWYNVVLGFSLIGVISFPCEQFPIPHYTFAAIFFVGNALVTGIFYKDKDKILSIILAILTIATLPFALMGYISILIAEWISLVAISIHFILSTINVYEPVNKNNPKLLMQRK